MCVCNAEILISSYTLYLIIPQVRILQSKYRISVTWIGGFLPVFRSLNKNMRYLLYLMFEKVGYSKYLTLSCQRFFAQKIKYGGST